LNKKFFINAGMLPKREIAHRLMRFMGWGSCEPLKPANEELGVNPILTTGSFAI
jgi:hypothetical protein